MNSVTLSLVVLVLCLPTIYAQVCGDGVCASNESPSTCPDDCGLCGNGVCDYNQFEDAHYCPADCTLYLETFIFGNDYVTWIPSSASGNLDSLDNGTNYLAVTWPARASTSFSGYFDIYNSDWANIVTSFYREGFFYYEFQIQNQVPVMDPSFPDFVIYSASTNSFLYYYFSQHDYTALSNGLWHSVSIDLHPAQWYYTTANSQGFVDFTHGSVSTNANWDSMVGKVSGIYIKGQFTNIGGGSAHLGSFQLANQGVTGICTPDPCSATHNCGSDGCGTECGTCSSGQTCQGGTCVVSSGPVTTGTTGVFVPVSTGSTGTTGIFSTGSTGTTQIFSTGTTGVFVPVTTGSTGTTGFFSTGSTGVFVPVSTGSTGTTGVFSTGSTGTTGVFSTGSTGTTGVFSTGSTGVFVPVSTGTTGIFSTGSTGTTGVFSTGSTGTTGRVTTGTTGTTGRVTTGTTGVINLCGNGHCDGPSETVFNCPEDCGTCGDHYCDPNIEDSRLCPEDCGYCGNGLCEPNKGENEITCEVDCQTSICGDGRCTAGESAQTCPADCIAPQPNTVQITLNFAGLIPAQDCCSCCGKK